MLLKRVFLVAAVAALVAGVASPAAAGANPPRRYASERDANPELHIVVKDRGSARPAVDVGITVTCGGFDLSGRFSTRLKRGNRIEVSGDLSGDGTDTYEITADLDGRLKKGRLSGTAAVSGRAFDNAGETGSCDEQFDWSAPRVKRAGLGDIEAEVRLSDAGDGDVHLAAGPDAIYAVTSDPATVKSIDPEDNRVAWELDVEGTVDAVAATEDAVWLLDAEAGVVRRLDTRSKSVDASIDVGPSDPDPAYPYETGIVAGDTDVWAAAGSGRELVHIDGDTAEEVDRIDLRGSVDSVTSDDDALYVNVVETTAGVPRTGDEPVHLIRFNLAGGLPPSEPNSDVSVELAAGGGRLWTLETLEVVMRDAVTLDGINRVQLSGLGAVAAAPGLWVHDGDDRLTIVDEAPQIVADVIAPGHEFTALAAGFGSVWAWDAAGGDVVRFATE